MQLHKNIGNLLLCLACLSSLQGMTQADISGYYTGELRLISRGVSLGLQLDIKQNGKEYIGVLRSRYLENNKIVGCDNFIVGTMEKNIFSFRQLIPLRETNVPVGTCNYFRTGRLTFSEKTDKAPVKGILVDTDNMNVGRVTIELQDSENSFAFSDEILEAARLVSEARISEKKDHKEFAEAIYELRSNSYADTIYVQAGQNITMNLQAPEADLFHKTSVLVNGSISLLNRSPRQQALQLSLPNIPQGEVEVAFICHHSGVDITFPTVLQVNLPDGTQKEIAIPVSTFTNRSVLIVAR